jgi:chromosome segregation ATPase
MIDHGRHYQTLPINGKVICSPIIITSIIAFLFLVELLHHTNTGISIIVSAFPSTICMIKFRRMSSSMIIYHRNHEGYYNYSPSFIRTSSTTRLWDKVDDDNNDDDGDDDDISYNKKKSLYKVYDEAIELINLEETIEKTQQVVKDVQNIPDKLKESVEETKQKMEEAVEKTQQVVKVVQNIPNKLKESVQETKETIKKKVKKTQQVVKDVQNIPNKLNQSVQETKETIEKKVEKTQHVVKDVQNIPNKLNESVQETVSDVKVLVGLKQPTWKQKLRQSQNADKPNTALGLASKATLTAGKAALWTGKGVASLAGKAAQVAYKKGKETIGTVVEEVWNDQVDTLSSSINATTSTISNLPSKIRSASASASRSLAKSKVDNSKSKREESENNIIVNNNPMRKTPDELGKEMKEAQDLAKEISDALEAAEKSMNVNNKDREFNDPMIEISPTIIRTGKPKKKVSSSITKAKNNDQISFIKNNIFNNTKKETPVNVRKLALGDINFTKTQDELDKEFEEARALAKEVSDALEFAEQALMVVTSGSSRNESENKST